MTETEFRPGKAELYEALCLAVRRFEHGLAALREGRGLTADAVAELRECSAGPVRALGARLRRLAVLPRYRLSAARLEAERQHGKLYLAREDQLANSCLLRIDQALDTSMDVLRELLAQNRWQLVEQMLDWAVALHPQVGAVAALEAAGAARLAGEPALAKRLIQQVAGDSTRDQLSGPIRQMLTAESSRQDTADGREMGFERREHAHTEIPYRIRCLADGPRGQLIITAFTDDLSRGGIYLHDVRNGTSRTLLDDIVATGVCYDPDKELIAAAALRGKTSPHPHAVFLSDSGCVREVLVFDQAAMRQPMPGFLRILGDAYYSRDCRTKALIEIDRSDRRVRTLHCAGVMQESIGFSVCKSKLVLNAFCSGGYHEYDPATGTVRFVHVGGLDNIYTLADDSGDGGLYAYGMVYVFSGSASFSSRIGTLTKLDAAGQIVCRRNFYSGVCSDMTVHCGSGEPRVFLATARGLISFTLGSAA